LPVTGKALGLKPFQRLGATFVQAPTMALTGVRHFNVPNVRRMHGGMLFVSNHQSFLDPVLVGMALNEPLCYLARRTLFDVPVLGTLIRALDTYPVARGQVDPAALKMMLKLLRRGERLLMFPEGTRTRDGALGVFRSGAAAIAVRTGVPVLPVCIEGAYRCWPRTRALPLPARVAVKYGRPIASQGMSAEELTDLVRSRILEMRGFLRRYMGFDE